MKIINIDTCHDCKHSDIGRFVYCCHDKKDIKMIAAVPGAEWTCYIPDWCPLEDADQPCPACGHDHSVRACEQCGERWDNGNIHVHDWVEHDSSWHCFGCRTTVHENPTKLTPAIIGKRRDDDGL